MNIYVEECLELFRENIVRDAATPAKKDMFEVDETLSRLNDGKDELFKHLVSKLLYVSKRCRLDILLAVGFLCTRVSKCTEQYWGKLRRVMQYLYRRKEEFLTLGTDDLSMIGCWVDAAYASHLDMRSHT